MYLFFYLHYSYFLYIITVILVELMGTFSKDHKVQGKKGLFTLPKLDNIPDNRELVYGCELEFEIPDYYDPRFLKPIPPEARTVKNRMLELFERQKLCDVMFRVEDEKIYVGSDNF